MGHTVHTRMRVRTHTPTPPEGGNQQCPQQQGAQGQDAQDGVSSSLNQRFRQRGGMLRGQNSNAFFWARAARGRGRSPQREGPYTGVGQRRKRVVRRRGEPPAGLPRPRRRSFSWRHRSAAWGSCWRGTGRRPCTAAGRTPSARPRRGTRGARLQREPEAGRWGGWAAGIRCSCPSGRQQAKRAGPTRRARPCTPGACGWAPAARPPCAPAVPGDRL